MAGPELGRWLMLVGAGLVALGLLLSLGGRLPWLGRLPGDIVYRKGDFTFYFPLVTCLLLSALLTIVLSLFRRG